MPCCTKSQIDATNQYENGQKAEMIDRKCSELNGATTFLKQNDNKTQPFEQILQP